MKKMPIAVAASMPPMTAVPMIWRATEPATLIWAEALDQGDWKVQVPNRDKVSHVRAGRLQQLLCQL